MAGIVAWARDGHSAWLPQALYLPMAVAGLSASGLTIGVAVSPLMAATGIFVGLRGAATLAGTGVLAWGLLAPVLVRTHLVPEPSYTAIVTWLVWPAFGMMLGGTIGPLLLGARRSIQVLRRTLGDARNLWRGLFARSAPAIDAATSGRPPEAARPGRHGRRVRAGGRAAGVHGDPSLRSVGRIHRRRGGGRGGAGRRLRTCSRRDRHRAGREHGHPDPVPVRRAEVRAGRSWRARSRRATPPRRRRRCGPSRAGQILGASVRAQAVAQLIGVVLGSLVVVPTYLAVSRVNPLGTERMPAVSALSWRATAEAVAGGLSGLPPHGLQGAVVAFVLGAGPVGGLARTRRPLPAVAGGDRHCPHRAAVDDDGHADGRGRCRSRAPALAIVHGRGCASARRGCAGRRVGGRRPPRRARERRLRALSQGDGPRDPGARPRAHARARVRAGRRVS